MTLGERLAMLLPAVLALGLAALPGQGNAAAEPAGPSDLPSDLPSVVSLARIREALARPHTLRVTLPEPTFRVVVEAHPFFRDVPHPLDFGPVGVPLPSALLGGQATTPPLISVDVLPLIRSALRKRAEDNARDEVRRALEQFNASNP